MGTVNEWFSIITGLGLRTMRAPRRRRKRLRHRATSLPLGIDLERLAQRASYVGSPEHKSGPSFAGRPVPRADATLCDPEFLNQQQRLTAWLKEAIRAGMICEMDESDPFPRYVWHRDQDKIYEAWLVNRELGQYKGYELQRDEWPEGV